MKKVLIGLLLLTSFASCGVKVSHKLDGLWHRDHSLIRLNGIKGSITGRNGKKISLKLSYDKQGRIVIREVGHTAAYLENWVPVPIAVLIVTNPIVAATRFVITKRSEKALIVEVHGWQVYYDHDMRLYYVRENIYKEIWKKQ